MAQLSVNAHWNGEPRIVLSARDNRLVIERPEDGSQPDFRAGELLMLSLASCIVGTLMFHSEIKSMPIREMSVDVRGDVTGSPLTYRELTVDMVIDGELTDRQRQMVERVAQACNVHNTLTFPVDIAFNLRVSKRSQT